MVIKVQGLNKYYQGFSGNEEKIDYLKYGLFNERGFNIDSSGKEKYDNKKVLRTNCDLRKKN